MENQTKDKATKRPWHTGRGLLVPDWCIYDRENELVVLLEDDKEGIANARVIVKAVNCHDELVEALKGIIEIGKRDMSNPKYDGYFEFAKKALQKAGEL